MNIPSNKQKAKKNFEQIQYNEINYPLTKKINSQLLSDKFTKNNMLVAVRTRPLSKSELEDSNYNTISVPDKDKIIVTIPTEYIPDDMSGIYLAGEQIKITKVKEVSYNYDFVFDENTPQNEVYRCTSSNLIKQVVEGFSATILAYGATGSGKTYTMVGKGENCGLMIRSIRDLFKFINNDTTKSYSIKISYVEVYNEVLKDLLSDKNKSPPELRADPNKGVVLQGAENKNVINEEEAFKLITLGNKRRTEKQTDRNQFSSRSHAVLQIYLEIQNQYSNINYNNFYNETSFGKFILVDLAGSEKTSSNSKSNSETGSINRSLLALGKCINLLVTQNKKFIPFRESKLTRILQEPLSGNGRIVMIATVSPSITNFDETMFTLQFANRAKSMKIHMKKNVLEADKALIKKYTDYIEELKAQINEVEKDIKEQQNMSSANISIIENGQKDSIQNSANNSHDAHVEEYEQIQKSMKAHFEEEVNFKKKLIEEEKNLEELKNDLSDLDYQMLHKPKVNVQYLKSQFENKQKEVEELNEKINNEYIKENELIKKRKEFEKNINELKTNNPGNSQVKNLFNIYIYYTNLLDNISNENRKYKNMNEIKRKENKISILTEQLDLRDLLINNANEELEKNNITFDYNDPNLATKEEIEMATYYLGNSPSYRSYNEISKNKDINFSKSEINMKYNNNKNQNTIETDSPSINLSRLKNLNRNDRFNSISKFTKKVKFTVSKENNNNEQALSNTNNNINNYKRNTSLNQKGQTLRNAGQRAIQSNYNQRGKSRPNKQNYIIDNSEVNDDQPLLQNLMLKKNENKNNDIQNNYNNYSLYDYRNMPVQVTNTTQLENEVQKKVKTILKKDFIGRYKRSPYLKLLNE